MLEEQQTLSVSEAASALGVSASYLRLAERLKVIPPANRSPGGQRRYTPEDIDRLRHLGVGQRKRRVEAADG
jgi:DNA-binding transcriptional MerR regulator